MRTSSPVLAAVSALAFAAALAPAGDAAACGGMFPPPSQNTEVASHRMLFSVSSTQSTLYDQIKYSGAPNDFAWVLPIKGMVQVGVSSDLIFEVLDQITAVSVLQPQLCNCNFSSTAITGTVTSSGSGGGVTVIAQQAVGPYDTVQLSSSDPNALTTWLTMNGYNIPASIQPTISAYVNEGFDFLALRLQPNMGVDAMVPVRVTTPGAGLSLPLRMVAAGVGSNVGITLWVLAEGRYQPTNFPSFTIPRDKVVWDFATETSNYADLEKAGFAATMNMGWLVEDTGPLSEQSISTGILETAMYDPTDSGYADSMGNNAPANAQADLDVLFAGIAPASFTYTRLFAQLPVGALSADLQVGASQDQSIITNTIEPASYVNAPPCNCGPGGSGGAGGSGGGSGGSGTGGSSKSGGGCDVGGTDTPAAFTVLVSALALAAARRRRTVG
jgi:uncharacterized membrane protein YgcG